MAFHVDLANYRGPLDLLLYLVRKHEVDVTDIPVAAITEQFLQYLSILEELSVDDVGEFIEVASTLLEIKSQQVLPRGGEEQEPLEDPREQLVERLLEYKKYKDAASILDEQSRNWQQHYARLADDLPPRKIDPATQPIQEVELWDLVSAFGRIMRDNQSVQPANIIYDDTPIQVYMKSIHQRLLASRRLALTELFEPGMHKSAMIGMFLAILELVRHHCVRTEQHDLHGEILVIAGEAFPEELEIAEVDDEKQRRLEQADLPVKPR